MQYSFRQIKIVFTGLTLAVFLMLGLAACVVQPIQSLEPNVLSPTDDLVVADIKDVDVSALSTDTLVIMPYDDLTKFAPEFEVDPSMTDKIAAIVRLGMLTEVPDSAAVVVSAEQIASGAFSIGDLVPRDALDLPYDSVGVIRTQPGFEMPAKSSTSPYVTIPLEFWLRPEISGAIEPFLPVDGVCENCSGDWWWCIICPSCCGL